MTNFIQAGTKLRCIDAVDSQFFSDFSTILELEVNKIYTAKSDHSDGFVELVEVPGYLYTIKRFEEVKENRSKNRFNHSTTASFDVDAQNGFTPLCPNELPVPGGDEIAAALNAQAAYARIRVGSKDAHSPNAHFVGNTWPRHCEVGTFGFELLAGLPKADAYDFFVYKGVEKHLHPYGACYHNEDWETRKKTTGVIEYLRSEGIKTVIVGGLATDYCVKNTALQLQDAGFQVILNKAACRGIAEQTINDAIAEMLAAGVIVVDDIDAFSNFE